MEPRGTVQPSNGGRCSVGRKTRPTTDAQRSSSATDSKYVMTGGGWEGAVWVRDTHTHRYTTLAPPCTHDHPPNHDQPLYTTAPSHPPRRMFKRTTSGRRRRRRYARLARARSSFPDHLFDRVRRRRRRRRRSRGRSSSSRVPRARFRTFPRATVFTCVCVCVCVGFVCFSCVCACLKNRFHYRAIN